MPALFVKMLAFLLLIHPPLVPAAAVAETGIDSLSAITVSDTTLSSASCTIRVHRDLHCTKHLTTFKHTLEPFDVQQQQKNSTCWGMKPGMGPAKSVDLLCPEVDLSFGSCTIRVYKDSSCTKQKTIFEPIDGKKKCWAVRPKMGPAKSVEMACWKDGQEVVEVPVDWLAEGKPDR